jgi:hypothetical protein
VGKPNKIYIYIYIYIIQLSRKYNTTTNITFPAKRNTSATKKQSQKFCIEKRTQVCTAVRSPPNLCLEKRAQQSAVWPAQYGPVAIRRSPENALVFVPKVASKIVPKLPDVQIVQIRTVQPNTKNGIAHTEYRFRICAHFLLGKCALSSCSLSFLKLTQKISLNHLLSSSQCILHTIQCNLL